MLEQALDYLRLGYPVFPVCSPLMGQHKHGNAPCKNVGKRPLVAWEAYQTRLPTIDECRRWWSTWERANIGMPTGRLSGVVVLDCDSGEAKKLAMAEGGLDKTPAVFTGKPGGTHYWLAHPGEEVSNFAGKQPGLDFRGDGGYVLVPPSRHVSGADYRWVDGTAGIKPAPVPPWLMDLLHGKSPDRPDEDAAGDHEPLDLIEILNGIGEGKRDSTIYSFACKMRNDNVPRQYADLMVSQAARMCRPPFEEADALEKVARAYRQFEPEQTFTVGPREAVSAPPGDVYPIAHIADLLKARVDDEEPFLVEGILWALRVTWIFSDPNSGKTLFLLALLLHIAAGMPFFGRPVRQGAVLVIEEDSPLSVLAEYIEMLADIYGFDLDTLPFYYNKLQGLRVTNNEGIQTAINAIETCPEKPVVVLLDACERIVPSDRFSTKELDPLTRLFQWCISERITPAMIDHTNRDRPKKDEAPRTPMETLYGARAKSAISDVMLHFSGSLKEGGVKVTFAKFRGETPPGFSITFDSAEGFSVQSERMTSRSPAEQDVMRFFNNSPIRGYSVREIEDAIGLKRRTLERVLGVLAKRRWLQASGATTDRRYHVGSSSNGVFG